MRILYTMCVRLSYRIQRIHSCAVKLLLWKQTKSLSIKSDRTHLRIPMILFFILFSSYCADFYVVTAMNYCHYHNTHTYIIHIRLHACTRTLSNFGIINFGNGIYIYSIIPTSMVFCAHVKLKNKNVGWNDKRQHSHRYNFWSER